VKVRAPLGAVGLIAAGAGMAGCSNIAGSGQPDAKSFDAMSGEEHLACAVDISAYSYLIAAGTVPMDKERYAQSLVALGWHQNAYAIPLGKGEQHALINQRREALIAKDAPEAIEARAIRCIISAVAKNDAS